MRPVPLVKHRKACPASGKRRFSSQHFAEIAARELHRNLNKHGELAVDTYGYRCPSCRSWHLTRDADHAGAANTLLHEAAPVELQRWAMGDTERDDGGS